MARTITTSLFTLAAIALLEFSNASAAEELWVIQDGVLNTDGIDYLSPSPNEKERLTAERPYIPGHPFWSNWHHCGGTTRNGLFEVPLKIEGRHNHARFLTAKSALGDCEFKVVFSCTQADSKVWRPNVTIDDRGVLKFSRDGSRVLMNSQRIPLPLKTFEASCEANVYDGKLHSMAVRRVGDRISFYYDGKQLNEQAIDPDVHLRIWFDALDCTPKIKSIKLTAEELSDQLKTSFKSATPIEVVFKGSRVLAETVSKGGGAKRIEGRGYAPGKACVYRIPALVVTPKGTILAFTEARASGYDWGHIRLVVRRSEDEGKTWGPEIDTTQGKFPDTKIGNPVPIVDRKSGRIFLIGHMAPPGNGNSNQRVIIVHSDDDGRTWSDARISPVGEWLPKGFSWLLTGPGHGIQLTQGKHKGRLIAPFYGEGCGFVVYSDDHGKTWTVGASSPNGPYNEAVCVELAGGDIMLNTRSPGGGGSRRPNRGSAVLTDGGTKYQEGTSRFIPELPCPSCQAGTARYSWPTDGKPGIILFAGPKSSTGRVRATLFASYDDGKTWPYSQTIYEGGSGYSDINVLPNGKIIYLFEKDGKANVGFTIVPAPPAEPPGKSVE